MILIIKKIKNKIAYQMGVAASQKVKYISNLNVGCQNSHKTIKQEPHTQLKHNAQEEQSQSKLKKKKKKKKEKRLDKTGGRLGEWLTTWTKNQ